jgi:hypothetical protein
MTSINLNEAYAAVYDKSLREQNEESTLSFIDELTDDELEEVVEEVVYELIDEGYEFNEVQNIFEEVIGEDLEILEEIELVSEYLYECGLNEYGSATVLNDPNYYDILESLFDLEEITEARAAKKRPSGGKSVEEIKAEIDSRETAKKAAKEAKKKPTVQLKVAKVKVSQPSTAGSSSADIKDNIKDKTATSAFLEKRRSERAAKKDAAKAAEGEQIARGRAKNIKNIRRDKESAAAAKDAEVRGRARNIRNIRMGKAVRKGIAQAQVSAYGKGREVVQSAQDTGRKIRQSAVNTMANVKRGLKSLIRKGAEKVAGAAGRVASRMQEETDLFDTILEYLVAEGYADTNESALVIMANMSGEWRDSIVEDNAAISAKVPSGRTVKMTATGKEPPGDRFVRQAGETIGRFLGSRGVQKIEPAPPQRKPLVSTSKPGPSNNFGRGF